MQTMMVAGQREVLWKLCKGIEHHLPGIVFRQQHDGVPHPLDHDLVAPKPILLGQTHGLAVAVDEKLCRAYQI